MNSPGKPISVLIFDTNTVFSRRIGEWLKELSHRFRVDYASNTFIMRRKLEQNKYDVLLADPITVCDAEEAEQVINDARSKTLVVLWSFMDDSHDNNKTKLLHLAKKPSVRGDMEAMAFDLATASA